MKKVMRKICVPDKYKVDFNQPVVFKHYFNFKGVDFNAIIQTENGELVFFDTECYLSTEELWTGYEKCFNQLGKIK